MGEFVSRALSLSHLYHGGAYHEDDSWAPKMEVEEKGTVQTEYECTLFCTL